MTIQVTTVLRPKSGRIKDALRMCKGAGKAVEAHGGKSRLYSALAAGPGSGELIAVSEWPSMEEYGKMVDQGPPRELLERLDQTIDPPVELVSLNIGMEVDIPDEAL